MIQLGLPALEDWPELARPWPVPARRRPARPRAESPQLALPLGSLRRLPLLRIACEGGPRPCPWISCRHHLLVDAVGAAGRVRLNRHALAAVGGLPFADWTEDEVDAALAALPQSCALDAAESGGMSQEAVAQALGGWWRTRVEAIEAQAKASVLEELTWLLGDEVEGML